MGRKLNWMARSVAIAVYGMSTITLSPASGHYFNHISSSEQITRDSWQKTGTLLKDAMDKVGGSVGKTSKTQNHR